MVFANLSMKFTSRICFSVLVRRRPKPDRRRALELLAGSRDGTEAIMIAHGFTIEQMVALVHAGLATATAERVVAGRRRSKSRGCASPRRGGRRGVPRRAAPGLRHRGGREQHF